MTQYFNSSEEGLAVAAQMAITQEWDKQPIQKEIWLVMAERITPILEARLSFETHDRKLCRKRWYVNQVFKSAADAVEFCGGKEEKNGDKIKYTPVHFVTSGY